MIKYLKPGEPASGLVYQDGTIEYCEEYFNRAGKPVGPPPKKTKIQRRIRLDRKLVEGWYEDPKYKLVIIPNKTVFVTVKGRRLSEEELQTSKAIKRSGDKVFIEYPHKAITLWSLDQMEAWKHLPEVEKFYQEIKEEEEAEKKRIELRRKEAQIIIKEIEAYLKDISISLKEDGSIVEATWSEGYAFGFGKHDYTGAYNKKGELKILAHHNNIPIVDKWVRVWDLGEDAYVYKTIHALYNENSDSLSKVKVLGFNYDIYVKSFEEFKEVKLPPLYRVGDKIIKLLPHKVKGPIEEWNDKEMR